MKLRKKLFLSLPVVFRVLFLLFKHSAYFIFLSLPFLLVYIFRLILLHWIVSWRWIILASVEIWHDFWVFLVVLQIFYVILQGESRIFHFFRLLSLIWKFLALENLRKYALTFEESVIYHQWHWVLVEVFLIHRISNNGSILVTQNFIIESSD